MSVPFSFLWYPTFLLTRFPSEPGRLCAPSAASSRARASSPRTSRVGVCGDLPSCSCVCVRTGKIKRKKRGTWLETKTDRQTHTHTHIQEVLTNTVAHTARFSRFCVRRCWLGDDKSESMIYGKGPCDRGRGGVALVALALMTLRLFHSDRTTADSARDDTRCKRLDPGLWRRELFWHTRTSIDMEYDWRMQLPSQRRAGQF